MSVLIDEIVLEIWDQIPRARQLWEPYCAQINEKWLFNHLIFYYNWIVNSISLFQTVYHVKLYVGNVFVCGCETS